MTSRPLFIRVAVLCLVSLRAVAAQQPMAVARGDFFQNLRDPMHEAAAALQGNRVKGASEAAVLDSALIVEVAGALRSIRQRVPDLQDALTDWLPAALKVALTPAVSARVRSIGIANGWDQWLLPVRDSVPVTGLEPFDSLSRSLHANHASVWGTCQETGDTFCRLYLHFSHYMNVPVVAAAYQRIPGVHVAYPDKLDVTFVQTRIDDADETGQQWLVTFVEGKGDCPAGCTAWIRTVVRYDRQARRAELLMRDKTGMP